jgi:hypothetical protein
MTLVVLDIGLTLIADPGPFEQGRARVTRLVEGTPAYEIVGNSRSVLVDALRSVGAVTT